jgi:hypothetical protein
VPALKEHWICFDEQWRQANIALILVLIQARFWPWLYVHITALPNTGSRSVSFVQDFFVGRTITFDEIDACLRQLTARWLGSFHVLASGEVGWYRRLNVADRVGTVATANAIVSLRSVGVDLPRSYDVVKALVSRQREDGGWSFVSNVSEVTVVDATASVLVALQDWQSLVEFRDLRLPAVLEKALDWLERASMPEGGWGMIAGAPYRNYSSALAVQALCMCGRRASREVPKAIHRFMSEADPATGGWQDANRHVSVPVTAEVVRALQAAADRQILYLAEVSRACNWLLSLARSTEFWEATQATANVEEVEVVIEGQRRRIEYGHSPRPVAIQALVVANKADTPEVVAAVRALVDDLMANRWGAIAGPHHSVPTSWMLYDVVGGLVAFRSAFSRRTDALWADNIRVVEHSLDQGSVNRKIREHKTKLFVASGCLALAWALKASGIVSGVGFATLLFVLSTMVLHVSSIFVFELLMTYKRRMPNRKSR